LPIIGPILNDVLAWFRRQGYSELTIRNNLKASRRLFDWLQTRRGPHLRGLSEGDFCAAYAHFRRQRIDVAAASRVLGRFLSEHELVRKERPEVLSRSERQIKLFGSYLREMRGLATLTVIGNQRRIRLFLKFLKFDARPSAIRELKLDQIEAFLRQSAKTNNRFSLQHIVASLRSFLRQQHARGILREPLHQRIDTPRTYRLERLPRALPWEKVTALLRSIDCSAPGGLRDFTLLYLAARYGLRSGELVRLTLDDIDWRAGTLKITQTKTKQALLLPLTDEAGDILVRYLKTGRPLSAHRQLFLRRRAPSGPLAATAVHDILEHRIALSGLELPAMGCHVLRHSLAVHLLRRGVRLPTIGAALGHRDLESTTVYLRLATEDLREVGLPVPKRGKTAVLKPTGWKQRLLPARKQPRVRLGHTAFRSGLAPSIRRYLETRRALGRAYRCEEDILRSWDDFLIRHYGKARGVRPEMFQSWVQTMPALTPTVRRNRMRIVRHFLLFHARRHPGTHIPDPLTFPRPSPHQPPRVVSVHEMARILATAASLPASHQNPLRAETIRLALVLLFCCGLRRGELLRLKIRDFDQQENLLRVEATKFHKSRLVPLPPSVASEVHHYLAVRRRVGQRPEPDAPLLWSNNPIASQNTYSAPALADNWHLLCMATGVLNERGRPPRLHDLRHSFAVAALSRWYQQGIDVQSKLPHLAIYLGHVSPVSTHYYLQLSSDLRHAASQRFRQYVTPLFQPGDLS
jgi:site-specific recombinase XerD